MNEEGGMEEKGVVRGEGQQKWKGWVGLVRDRMRDVRLERGEDRQDQLIGCILRDCILRDCILHGCICVAAFLRGCILRG